MPFFEPPEPPPEPTRPPRYPWTAPPRGEIGVPTDLQAVFVRSSDWIMFADHFRSYSTGFEVVLTTRARDPGFTPIRRPLPRPGTPVLTMPAFAPGVERVRFGVAFSDGRRATNVGRPGGSIPQRPPDHPLTEPHPPHLAQRAGSGNIDGWLQNFWLWGVPPPGPLGLVIEWPAEGIPETRVDVDADVIRDACARAEVVWEETE